MSMRILLFWSLLAFLAGVALMGALAPQPLERPGPNVGVLYLNHCAACHGPQGRGDGPRTPDLNPPPHDFQRNDGKYASRHAVRQVIAVGAHGTAMPGFSDVLTPAQIDGLAALVLSWREQGDGMHQALAAAGFAPLAVPRAVPSHALTAADGQRWSESAWLGRHSILYVWSPHCAPCVRHLPEFTKFCQRQRTPHLQIFGVCRTDGTPRQQVVNLASELAAQQALVLDEEGIFAAALDVRITPSTLILDTKGRAFAMRQGPCDWESAHAQRLLALLEGGVKPE